MPLSDPLESRLHCAESLRIRQDDESLDRTGLLDRASVLRTTLQQFAGARVAMLGERADRVLAAMLACQELGCELLLLRESIPLDSDRWRALSVSAVLGQGGMAAATGVAPARVDGFSILIATSGTTGVPKVARHRVGSLIGRIRAPKNAADGIRWLLTYHPASFAGIQVLLTALTTGGELLATGRASVGAFAALALAYKPTHVSGTPTFWRGFLLALGARADEVPIAFATLGGEAVDQGTLDRIAQAFPGVAISHIYASTEAGALFAVRDGKAGFPAAWLASGVDGVSLRIVDGMFEVASPRAMDRYVSPGSTSPVGDDGWLRTGDLVEVEHDRVVFRGRADATINVGGSKVSPETVESVLLELTDIVDVRAFGVRNPITGQVVGVEVVSAAGLEPAAVKLRLLAHARARLAAAYVPRVVKFSDAIEASPTGKKARTA